MNVTITTVPGYINRNGQRVISEADGGTFLLRCGKCTTEYCSPPREISDGLCPHCQGGESGLPIAQDTSP